MATDTAPAPARPVAAEPRRLWQLPTFVLGAVALYAAVTLYPPPPRDGGAVARAELAALRTALDRKPFDRTAVEALVGPASAAADRFPESATVARYLAASGMVALAEADPADADRWAAADALFAKVPADQLPDGDRKKFTFRAAKAAAATGTGDPADVLRELNVVPAGEEKGELPRLTAAVALRQTPPDQKRARDELSKYLGGAHRLPADTAARLKLQLAELHLALNEPDRARGWLKDIPTAAPADVQATARLSLARLAAAENNWAEAVTLYEAAAASPGLPADQAAAVRLNTGVALAKLNRPEQAGPFLEQAARDGGSVGAAAAARLAELIARDPKRKGNRSAAGDLMEKAIAPPGPAPHLTAAELSAITEVVVKACVTENDYPTAVRAAAGDPGQRAELYAAWAESLGRDPAAADKHAAAGADYLTVAETASTPAAKTDRLRKAVAAFKAAGDTARATAAVETLLASGGLTPEQLGQALVDRADLLPPNDIAGKKAALERAIGTPGPGAAAARHRLGLLLVDRGRAAGDTPEGTGQVKLGLDLLAQAADASAVGPADKAEHEAAVYDLGCSLMRVGRAADAVARFRTQLNLYPSGPTADRGRLWLATALILLASTDRPSPDDPRLAEAVTAVEPLAASPEEWLRAQAELRTLNAFYHQNRTDDIRTRGTAAMNAFRGKPDELAFGVVVVYAGLRGSPPDQGLAFRTVERMEQAFAAMSPTAFPTDDPEYSHAAWSAKLPKLRKLAETPLPEPTR